MGNSVGVLALVAEAAGDRLDAARTKALAFVDDTELSASSRVDALTALAFADYLDARFADAVTAADRAVELAEESGAESSLILAHSMRMLASAGPVWAGDNSGVDYFELVWSRRAMLHELDVELRIVASHFLAEGLLATGRLSEATEVHDEMGDLRLLRRPDDEARTPYPPFMLIQRARILIFRGAIADARQITLEAIAQAERQGNMQCLRLAEAFLGLIHALLDDRVGARRAAHATSRDLPSPRGLLETGAWIVNAYALFAIGDRDDAARCVLMAGGNDELTSLQLLDRALGYDILVASALEHADLRQAELWGALTLPLAAHPAATLVVEQSVARLDAARGNAMTAAEAAQVVAARARLTGRYLDAVRAELMQANALAAAGHNGRAIKQLADVAHDAALAGVPLLERSAARELRRLGRRVPPRRGAGWESLSERERQIAILAAEGFSNRVIGRSLFLSERTVQSYISRVLVALELSSRAGLPASVPADLLPTIADGLTLTARQWEVAVLVAQGRSNRELAAYLGISVKTAEKHIGEILRRWGIHSRTGIANLVTAGASRWAS